MRGDRERAQAAFGKAQDSGITARWPKIMTSRARWRASTRSPTGSAGRATRCASASSRCSDLAARLGDPQKSFRSIHVAGTKGKGSVSALIEAALAHAGLRVGRYASPHVERITERVSVQGHDVDEPTLARALNRALDAYEAARTAGTPAANATWFDLLTAAAFIIFAKRHRVGGDRSRLGRAAQFDQHRRRRNRNRHQHRARAYGNSWATRARRSRARRSGSSSRAPCSSPRSTQMTKLAASLQSPSRRARLAGQAHAPRRLGADRTGQFRARSRRARRASPQGGERGAPASRSARRFSTSIRAPPRVCPGAWSALTLKSGPATLARRHGRRACAVQHRRRLARSRPYADLSGPCVAIVALAADKDAKVSWPNSPGAPRPSSSPICRDQAGAARRPNCRRSRIRSGS